MRPRWGASAGELRSVGVDEGAACGRETLCWSNYLFPALAGQRGTIDCDSNTNIAATALRFIGTGGAFSSLPVISKPSSGAAAPLEKETTKK
jgi:hypothetical protein